MVRRRGRYDWLANGPKADHWLIVETMTGAACEAHKLPAGTNLKNELIGALARWSSDGWDIEEFSSKSSGFFCNRHGDRRFVHISPTDPSRRS